MEKGFRFSLLVFGRQGEKLVLPKNWFELPYERIKARFAYLIHP